MAAETKTLSAKEVVTDIRAGATDEFLMKKYSLSERGLQSLFQRLVTAKALTQTDVDNRESVVEEVEVIEGPEIEQIDVKSSPSTSPQSVFKCPACGKTQPHGFEECPECGCPVERYLKCKEKDAEIERQRLKEDPHKVARSIYFMRRRAENRAQAGAFTSIPHKTSKMPKLWQPASAIGSALAIGYFLFFMPYATIQAATGGTYLGAFVFGVVFVFPLGLLIGFVVWLILRGVYSAITAMNTETSED